MNDQEFERASDPIDAASNHELKDSATILKLHANRFRPLPEFDCDGNKVCVQCGEVIPALRAAISDVVCCIMCQTEQEKARHYGR